MTTGSDWSSTSPRTGGSVAHYEGDRIRYLYDHYPDGMSDEVTTWTRACASDFSASYV